MHCFLSALVLTLAVSSISSATRMCETADVYMEHMAGGFNFDSSVSKVPEMFAFRPFNLHILFLTFKMPSVSDQLQITIPEDCTKLSIGGHNEKFGDASAIALAEALRDSFAVRPRLEPTVQDDLELYVLG